MTVSIEVPFIKPNICLECINEEISVIIYKNGENVMANDLAVEWNIIASFKSKVGW